jgi:DNA-binding XRE family transcriptional regulator
LLEEDLTNAEKFFLLRWRGKKSIRQMAADFEVSPQLYRAFEDGSSSSPDGGTGGLDPNERYVIYRRRRGISQAEVARRMGVRSGAISAEERGHRPIKLLLEFWGA